MPSFTDLAVWCRLATLPQVGAVPKAVSLRQLTLRRFTGWVVLFGEA